MHKNLKIGVGRGLRDILVDWQTQTEETVPRTLWFHNTAYSETVFIVCNTATFLILIYTFFYLCFTASLAIM